MLSISDLFCDGDDYYLVNRNCEEAISTGHYGITDKLIELVEASPAAWELSPELYYFQLVQYNDELSLYLERQSTIGSTKLSTIVL